MQSSKYTNIAFISYKREDENWAKWLQKKLEHYKLPTEIRKQNPDLEFSESPRHVFKDTTDLSGGVLAKAIKNGLESSKYLIVICSPRAAKSKWVCKEVQDFIDSGREEFIIPFIIEGEPYANSTDYECFPAALKSLAGERELLGINVHENGKDFAAIKVIAHLFDLQLGILWDRFKQEEKKRHRGYLIGLVSLIILVATIAFCFAKKNVELDKLNYQIEKQNKQLIAERIKLSAAYDSISKQKADLQKANDNLFESNQQLNKEKNNVLMAHKSLKHSFCKLTVEKANSLIQDGNILLATRLLISEAKNNNYDFELLSRLGVEKSMRIAYDKLCENRLSLTKIGPPFSSHQFIIESTFNRDGTKLFYSINKNIYVYDTNSGKLLSEIPWKGNIYKMLITDDENYLIIGDATSKVSIFSLLTGKVETTLFGENGITEDITIDKKEKLVAICNSNSFSIWNLKGKLITRKEIDGRVDYLQFSPDSKYLTVSGQSGCYIYNIHKQVFEGKLPSGKWSSKCHFNKDGTYVSVGSEDSIAIVCSFPQGKIVRRFKNNSYVNHTFLNDDATSLLVGNGNHELSIYKFIDSTCHDSLINAPYLAIGDYDGRPIIIERSESTIKLLDVFQKKEIDYTVDVPYSIIHCDINLNSKFFLAATKEGAARLWSLNENSLPIVHGHKNSQSFFGEKYMIRDASFCNDGNLFATIGDDNIVNVWNYPGFNNIAKLTGHTDEPHSVRFSNKKDMLLTCGYDKMAILWSIQSYQPIRIFQHDNSVAISEFIDNEERILTTSGNGVYIWNAKTGILERKMLPETTIDTSNYQSVGGNEVTAVLYNERHEEIIAGYRNGTIRIWNSINGHILKTINCHSGKVELLGLKSSDTFLSWSDNGELYLWENSSTYKTLKGHHGSVYSACFVNYGKQIVSSAEDGNLFLWNIKDINIPNILYSASAGMQQLRPSKDGKYILALCSDNTLKVIDIAKRKCTMDYANPNFYICPLFDYSNQNIIAPLGNGWIYNYEYPRFSDLVDILKNRCLNYKLTEKEIFY